MIGGGGGGKGYVGPLSNHCGGGGPGPLLTSSWLSENESETALSWSQSHY